MFHNNGTVEVGLFWWPNLTMCEICNLNCLFQIDIMGILEGRIRKQAVTLVILEFSAALTSRQQEFPSNWSFPKVGLINLSCLRPSLFQFGVEMKSFERLLSAVYSNLLRLFIETNISEKRPRLEYISIQELRQKSVEETYKSYHFFNINMTDDALAVPETCSHSWSQL